jgi:hypothetical protein
MCTIHLIETETQLSSQIFDSLTRSAFDFLDHALAEFDAYPKYALIDLAAAIELVFKARLVLIDSIWVAEEPTEATLERFKQGKVRTVGLDLAKNRIKRLTGEEIDAVTFKVFKSISSHRNRVVHFYHDDLNSEQQREMIAGEIYVAWYYLHRLLTGQWQKHFLACSKPISEFGARLQSLTRFFDAVFECVVKTHPKKDTYTECPVCHYKSLDFATGDRYRAAICHVCGYIEPSHKAIQHGEENFVASCAACSGYQTVQATDFGFKCSECGESFADYITCEYCNEHWVGNADPDYGDRLRGCEYCGGVISNIKDD